jgi:hypothetical protein
MAKLSIGMGMLRCLDACDAGNVQPEFPEARRLVPQKDGETNV